MTDRELMKQALDVLEDIFGKNKIDVGVINRLRERLAQPEQEPVAWMYPEGLGAIKRGLPWVVYGRDGNGAYPDGVERIPLYLHNDAVARRVEPRASGSGAGFESLPASPQWQGLTDQEIWSDGSTMDLLEDGIRNFARAIEAKLKEKNS